ncbi:T9SS C-terminal target domain-containing protein [Chryseobacterium nematophagum]|uniref:T9SS C-terminal target domain-containing protein n=1 Tax=Chryseobacterium nematophagum TaxID=2305228 RepID=A0A3M7LHX8_9FLAO|nr:S8 family peptidase [Chryseobacterium nematophagum]RMZ61216.1 T9SS C-terminal target domain-containing protein [Chryseobacterium nematophagum]
MKKIIILLSSFMLGNLFSQWTPVTLEKKNNEKLSKELELSRKKNLAMFDAYVARNYGSQKDSKERKEIEAKRNKLAGFALGKPYFFEKRDIRQGYNSNADIVNSGGISGLTGSFNGEGIKYTVFDGGRVYESHTAFNNLPNRIINKEDDLVDYDPHATAVSGFIGSKSIVETATDPDNNQPLTTNAKGIAENSLIDSYTFESTILPGDVSQKDVFQKIMTAQAKISNHSYGADLGWSLSKKDDGTLILLWNGNFQSPANYIDLQGTYLEDDKKFDQIVYNNPSYIIVKAAGNEYQIFSKQSNSLPKYYNEGNTQFQSTDILPPDNCAQGYDCISDGLAKNIIVVGASDIIASNNFRYVSSSDVVHSSYSNVGPRDDGGIKPDITAVGTNVLFPSTSEIGSSEWKVDSGTSFSTPIVTGIIGLWAQIHQQLFNNTELNAASAKTLMIHSAAEAGNIGPDPIFGWGLIDAKKGAEMLVGKANNSVIFNDETLNSGVANTKMVKASGNTPLKVTLSWIDPASNVPENAEDLINNKNSKLINDLDVRIIDMTTNTVYYPWKLDPNNPLSPALKSDNTVDNVEQVIIDTPVTGRDYKIQITNKGNLVNNDGNSAPQNYSIMVSGYSEEVLGTKEVSNLTSIAIVPSVTKDFVNILKAPKKSAFNIYDLSGKRLRNGIINNENESIDLSSYPKGIYIIEIKSDKDTISKKVIKQ